jgi:hypothetical protein
MSDCYADVLDAALYILGLTPSLEFPRRTAVWEVTLGEFRLVYWRLDGDAAAADPACRRLSAVARDMEFTLHHPHDFGLEIWASDVGRCAAYRWQGADEVDVVAFRAGGWAAALVSAALPEAQLN